MNSLAIIGGGLVGASLALALQNEARTRGWRITLIEPFAPGDAYQPSYDARSTALAYGTRLIYQRLGVWPGIAEHAEPIVDIHVSDKGRFAAARLSAREEGVEALGYVADNAWIGHCLWQALDDRVIDWRCPARVVSAQALEHGYRLQLDDGSSLDCGLAVLADGGRSPLREQLGVAISVEDYGQTALIANVTPSNPHNGMAFERFTDQGPMALLPLSRNRCALVWSRPHDEATRLQALPPPQFLHELQDTFGYRLGSLLQVGDRHLYPLALTKAKEQIRPHLVLLGNAAHSLHPVAGQGYNLSLRDTLTLAEELIASQEPLGTFSVLQRYLQRQQLDQQLTVGFSDQVTRLFSNALPILQTGRNLGLLGLDLLPPAKHWFARQAMGMGVRSP